MERIAIIGEYNPLRDIAIKTYYEQHENNVLGKKLIFMDYKTEKELYKMIKTAFRMEVNRIILSTSDGLAEMVKTGDKYENKSV